MNEPAAPQSDRMKAWSAVLDNTSALLNGARPIWCHGRLTRATGMIVEAAGLKLPVGSICLIEPEFGGTSEAEEDKFAPVEAEVVGFVRGHLLLMPATPTTGLSPGARVSSIDPPVKSPRLGQRAHPWKRVSDRARHLPIGPGALGRVLDAQGKPLDGFGPLNMVQQLPIRGRKINAMERAPIHAPLDTGVRAINSLLTVGRGQRIGLFAGAGVGKSVLLGMMAKHTNADVIVVGLIGERGREVREFIDHTLGPAARQRATVIVAPADEPPLMKIQAANYATALAEFYRAQGLHVLLLMDSLTRYSMAMREVALAVGEPPATRGYPPSVFAKMPELIERAGNGDEGSGSITAFYTVLVEGDDPNDPVGDAARSFLDGHIVLSRSLAETGHFPAIDIEQSISRVMTAVVDKEHAIEARGLRAAWSKLQKNRDLINLGAYQAGADPLLDRTIECEGAINALLQQNMDESSTLEESRQTLRDVVTSLYQQPQVAAEASA